MVKIKILSLIFFAALGTSNFLKESLLGRTNKDCFIKRHNQTIMRVLRINVN